MEKPWKVVFAFVAVFIAGAIFGGGFTLGVGNRRLARLLTGSPPAKTKSFTSQPPAAMQILPAMMRQLTERLGLTPEQREKIRPIVAKASGEFQRLRKENVENTARVAEQMYADVSAQLSPEQREQLDEMKRKMQERFRVERERQRKSELFLRERKSGEVPSRTPKG